MSDDKYSKYEVIVGLEVHAQLSTHSKMYSGDSAEFGASPNTHVSVISLGHPGTLPMVNKTAIEYAVKIGLATHCDIRHENQFARKNYFYADLPKGYQITQDKTPICTGGYLEFEVNGEMKKVRLTRIHMEEDAGKSIHDIDPYFTLVDLNRAGVPLIEIVSEPDIRSGDEAMAYLNEVQKLVRYLEICDGNMEEGSMRCDANISVRLKGTTAFNPRSEVKNMNSMRNVKRAIDFEFTRQVDLIEAGEVPAQETRGFDAVKGITLSQRSKEHAHDYRYFPEPDLPPVVLTDDYIDGVKAAMPKLPNQLINEYISDYGLPAYDARIITDDKELAGYFNELLTLTKNYKAAANWILGPVKNYLNENGQEIRDFKIKPQKIGDLIWLIDQGKTNFSTAANKLFPILLKFPEHDVESLVLSENLMQLSDEEMLGELVEQVIKKYPQKVEEYRKGKKGLLGLFVGEVMKLSKGKADPKVTNKLVLEVLEKEG
ncbi:MAG TPA: Asp-tRNA(Asn)/Glu-tRNA(Gln) amidotransferase subunit GatB [Chitinophagales bacterium]|nr:Asp-tRNA(Asn)/Glu-tRNA(Gln) amidotransferase subunit GatB [Chitinophagales bacterium]